jgi:hypothetical protein
VRTLPIARNVELPLDAVTQKLAFMGRTGGGKSYAASKLAELMLEAGAQVVVIDPVGAWHGLRLPGRGAGFEIPVLGGLHGDVPLEPTGGALVADLITDRALSAVLDVSQMLSSEQARFVTDFATRFFQKKKAAPSAVHLFLEECQEMIPQNAQPGEQRMLHAFERMVKLGRNFGIGVSLISQRPQEVNKKALNQTECLFAFQMTGPQERKAMVAWMSDKGMDTAIGERLPSLATGHALLWSPSWLRTNVEIHVLPKRSADASSTPKVGAKARAAEALTPIDLAELSVAMAETIERTKAEDPKELRKRIAELERQVAKGGGERLVEVEVPVLGDADRELLGLLKHSLEQVFRSFDGLRPRMSEVLERFEVIGAPAPRKAIAHRDLKPDNVIQKAKPERDRPPPAQVRADGTAKDVRSGARHILAVAARHYPHVLSRDVLAARSGMAASGGTYATYIGDLKRAGYLADNLAPTERGIAAAGVKPRTPMTRAEIVGQWRKLRAGARRLLDLVLEHGPIARERLAELAGMEASGGTFNTYLGDLRRPGLILTERSGIVVGPALEDAR